MIKSSIFYGDLRDAVLLFHIIRSLEKEFFQTAADPQAVSSINQKHTKGIPSSLATPAELERNAALSDNSEMKELLEIYKKHVTINHSAKYFENMSKMRYRYFYINIQSCKEMKQKLVSHC